MPSDHCDTSCGRACGRVCLRACGHAYGGGIHLANTMPLVAGAGVGVACVWRCHAYGGTIQYTGRWCGRGRGMGAEVLEELVSRRTRGAALVAPEARRHRLGDLRHANSKGPVFRMG